MTKIIFLPLETRTAKAYRDGALDANGCAPERAISNGEVNPCRHCLDEIPKGAEMLILAHRPFDRRHAYAETGPIFLCADDCPRWSGKGVPPILQSSPDYLVKGYTEEERIRYGTGRIVARDELSSYAEALVARDDVAFVDVRSARNNCFQARIVAAPSR